jgi:hypothetical protein
MSETTAPAPVAKGPAHIFSKSKMAFFNVSMKDRYVASGIWPDDGVEVPDDEVASWWSVPAGKVLAADGTGAPAWADAPAPTEKQALATLRHRFIATRDGGVLFTPTGAAVAIVFPSDAEALSQIAGGLWDGDLPILDLAGSPETMTVGDAASLAAKVKAFHAACIKHYAELVGEVKANVATDITVGWPSNV